MKSKKLPAGGHSYLDAIDTIHTHNLDIDRREIFIHSVPPFGDEPEVGVDFQMATQSIKNLHILLHESKDPVTIHLHTDGGYVADGLAIYDTIKLMPYHTTIISYTSACSMSGIILQAATHRVLLPHAHFMLHEGTWELTGTPKQIQADFAISTIDGLALTDIYIDALKKKGKYTDKSRAQIKAIIRKEMDKKTDVYLTATEALEWGFADSILETF